MSHRSKVDFLATARDAGYKTYLYFIAPESSDLNISRVLSRTVLGGHDVPQSKIVERYKRSLELLGRALSNAYRAFLFDNSGVEPIWLAELSPDAGFQLKVAPPSLPDWFKTWVVPRYPDIV